jgi:oligosaccharide repeat unit polymerase
MTAANVACIVGYSALVAVALVLLDRHRRANPVYWFLVLQWVIGVGTMAAVDLTRTSDVAYTVAIFLATLAFFAGHLLMAMNLDLAGAAESFWSAEVESDRPSVIALVGGITVVSVAVTYAYYQAVGYNILLSLITGEILEDVVSMRLASYSGTEYFAPGYANQFKNVLLPLGLSALAVWAWIGGRRRLSLLVVATGSPIALWALLGTGQRGAFVYAMLALLFGLSALGHLRVRTLLLGVPVAVFLFGAMSFYIGRISSLDAGSIIGQVAKRAFVNEQTEGLVGFRYVHSLENAWFSEWGTGLMGILPGHPGSDLDHVIFGLINGTTRGTSTLPTVGSVFHNGGWAGLVVFYVLLGMLYTQLYHRFLSGGRTVLRCLAYGALFFHLAYFVAGAPIGMVNKGVVALGMVILLRKMRWDAGAEPMPSRP